MSCVIIISNIHICTRYSVTSLSSNAYEVPMHNRIHDLVIDLTVVQCTGPGTAHQCVCELNFPGSRAEGGNTLESAHYDNILESRLESTRIGTRVDFYTDN